MSIDPDDPRLTAYALGELEDDDKADLEQLLAVSDEARRTVVEVRETMTPCRDARGGGRAGAQPLKTIDRELGPRHYPISGRNRPGPGGSGPATGSRPRCWSVSEPRPDG